MMANNPTPLQEEYTARINRVIDYIEIHLDRALSLDTLAEMANFAKFYCHRLVNLTTFDPLFPILST